MAIGLFFLTIFPGKELLENHVNLFAYLEASTDELKDAGLQEFKEHLIQNGGFRPLVAGQAAEAVEYNALDAIHASIGKCTEQSKILFAVMRMAGLSPQFVGVKLKKDSIDHLCIGININGRLRLFDPAQRNSDAKYARIYPFTLRQYFSLNYSNSGAIWNKRNNFNKALAHFDLALEIDDQNTNAYNNRGYILSHLGRFNEAVQDLTYVVDSDPNADAFHHIGTVLAKKGDLDGAIEKFAEEMRFKQSPRVFRSIGDAYYEKSDLTNAIDYYRKAIELDPNDTAAHIRCALTFHKKGDLDQAIEFYTKTLQINADREFDASEIVLATKYIAQAYKGRSIARAQKGDMIGAQKDRRAYEQISQQANELAMALANN